MALSDEIKARLELVDVVSGYVPSLQKAGRNFKALCPFHGERTPSFIVFPERQTWRCFGACATGGDVLSFVMRVEKLTFSEAVKLLAARAGVVVAPRRERQELSEAFRVNDAAAAFFQEMLRASQGMAARAYLEQRGVDADAIGRFQLGLSPPGGARLLEHLASIGYSQEQVLKAGLATKRQDGSAHDLFAGRLMFPIKDDRSNLAGFGGRSLDGSDPKYLNSPRTDVFDKGGILYALHLARNAIRTEGEGVVVEGYMDVIAAHQHGFANVVASMGTALTAQQVALLRGAGKRFVLALDPDTAGQEATFRDLVDSWRIFERRRVAGGGPVDIYERATAPSILRVAILPAGKDPDELIREDPDGWRQTVAKAQPLLDYLFASIPDHWDVTTSEGKARAAEALSGVIASLDNPFEQERYFRRLAEALGVQPATLEASIGKPSRSSGRRGNARPQPEAAVAPFVSEGRDALEELTLALLLRWPDLRGLAQGLDPQALVQWESREIFTAWTECATIEGLFSRLNPDLRQRIDYLSAFPIPPMDLRQREQAMKDCVHRLEERRLRDLKIEEALLLEEGGQPDDMAQRVVDTNERLRQLFEERSWQRGRS